MNISFRKLFCNVRTFFHLYKEMLKVFYPRCLNCLNFFKSSAFNRCFKSDINELLETFNFIIWIIQLPPNAPNIWKIHKKCTIFVQVSFMIVISATELSVKFCKWIYLVFKRRKRYTFLNNLNPFIYAKFV